MNRLPTQQDILKWITENPHKAAKRDIAKAFNIKGAARIELKKMLRDLADAGHIEKKKRHFTGPDGLPPVALLRVTGVDGDGDVWASPIQWDGNGEAPKIAILQGAKSPVIAVGDTILTKITADPNEMGAYTGKVIRKIGVPSSRKVMGLFRAGRIVPIDKKGAGEWQVIKGQESGAKEGDLVEGEQQGRKPRMGLPQAQITAVIGDALAPKALSLIAIHQNEIPHVFPDAALQQAQKAKWTGDKSRTDLTHLSLITIDPSDARDHDDACCVLPDADPKNKGGFILWVAIADVAAFVSLNSPLDIEAQKRGNSTYFPDRVVPMLPDTLSGDLCSLHEGVLRPCLAVEIKINAKGEKLSHAFHRGQMKSPAALTYEEAQDAVDGQPNAKAKPLVKTVLRPLFDAYGALQQARALRQPLNLNLPEREIKLGADGTVQSVHLKQRLAAHMLIEEFMVLANVCAAETLIAKKAPTVFRVHEDPDPQKIDALRKTARASGLALAKGQRIDTAHLNQLLQAAAGTDAAEAINLSTLRSMAKAHYTPDHFGHFGLALQNYVHFTSPIRRYADVLIHRALIAVHGWGDDDLPDGDDLQHITQHISETERRSMMAERDTTDRYLARFLADRVGAEFTGRITGIAGFGLFVELDDTGADALVPIGTLGNEYYTHDADAQTLTGRKTGVVIRIGQTVVAKLAEADPITGGMVLEVLQVAGVKFNAMRGGKKAGRPYKSIAANGGGGDV